MDIGIEPTLSIFKQKEQRKCYSFIECFQVSCLSQTGRQCYDSVE
ncbi:hypothetical protein PUND_b0497 [Pseudoalteromonas undina]|nr:hypothetical protein PUND_b0497 [Pseudoalteromonas undina]